MRSLTLRIFLSFWLIIVLLLGLAAVAGYAYSERLREAYENFEIDDSALAASAALESGGRAGLVDWLRDRPATSPMDVYIVDSDGNDLLGRKIPNRIARILRRFRSHDHDRGSRRRGPSNLRPPSPLPQLVAADGTAYSLFVNPKRNPWREWLSARAGPAFLMIAIALSALMSYALARAITTPVRRFRDATVAIADGKLDTRVAASMSNRRDEIGMLAHDLDAMATRLQNAANQQTELTRNISHELRSPLARLRVALELARREAGDLAEFRRIDRETERLDEMIGQILEFSRMDTRSDDAPQQIDIDQLLHEVVEDANYECRSTDGITVSYDSVGPIPYTGFAAALTSVFENVLRNAIRHSPANGVISVQASTDDAGARISVIDQGPGVTEDALEQLFEPFYRAPTTDESLGTGLGLAIARRAIEKNGGTISAANVDGGGLAIAIQLPESVAGG